MTKLYYRNKNTNAAITKEEYNTMLKREYENYLELEDKPVSFEKYSELDGDFEVVVWDKEEEDYILYNDYMSK